MTTYKIYRWDGFINAPDGYPRPAVYIKPDIKLLDFSKMNDYRLNLKITGTGSDYDKYTYEGVLDKSSLTPNCRPNFFDQTGLYVITLDAYWFGYPTDLGEVIVVDLKDDSKEQVLKTEEPPSTAQDSSKYTMSNIMLILILVFLIVIIIGFYVYGRSKKLNTTLQSRLNYY